MITRYGMSKKLGALTFGHTQEQVFLGRELGQEKGYSEEVASAIDQEARRMIDAAYEKCTQILQEHADQLHLIAKTLYEKETVEADEFLALMEGKSLDAPKDSEPHGDTTGDDIVDVEFVSVEDHAPQNDNQDKDNERNDKTGEDS